MTAGAKIEQLLELTGTPPERRAGARKNYNSLVEREGEQAIDQRIAEFEAMHSQVTAWRESRRPAAAAATASADVRQPTRTRHDVGSHVAAPAFLNMLAREKLLARRLEGYIDALMVHVDHLWASQRLADIDQIATLGREAGFLTIEPANPFGTNRLFSARTSANLVRLIEALADKGPSNAEHSLFEKIEDLVRSIESASPVLAIRRIDTDQTLSGLGRIAAFANDLVPDAIFTLNRGGASVGRFVKEYLRLDIPVIPLEGDSTGVRLASSFIGPPVLFKPLVIDDVARSGRTVAQAFDWIGQNYPSAAPRATTIAASLDAIELVGQACLLTSNPMEHGAIELPYDPHAGFAIETLGRYTVYVFGANATSPENRLVVSTDIVDKLVAEQGRLFAEMDRVLKSTF